MTGRSTPEAERWSGLAGSGEPADIVDAQVEALLQRIAADRDRRCGLMRAAADLQARDLLRLGRKEARASVHEAVARERRHAELAVQQAQASAALEVRQRAQQATRAILEAMWAAIVVALEARWNNTVQRRTWLQAAVHQAQGLLSEHTWRIEHGADLAADEREELAKAAAAGDRDSARTVALACLPAIRAGIKISTAGACLDATVAGLLASRAHIESEFLAQYLALSPAAERSAHE